MDTDNDGRVSRSEFITAGRLADEFDSYDTDKDGFINKADIENIIGQPFSTRESDDFDYIDTDNDGRVSRSEFIASGNFLDRPEITLRGDASETVEAGGGWWGAGATARDTNGTYLEVTITGSVDTSVPGTYTLTYNATDATGNAATAVTRTVIVVDTTAPTITLNGDASVTVETGAEYEDKGATSSDIVDGDRDLVVTSISLNGTEVDSVDTSGTYTLTYTAKDAAENPAVPVTRTVIVLYDVQCLEATSEMKVEDQKYMLNDETEYSENRRYGLNIGTYTITNVPENHPVAILNAGKTDDITYSGDESKKQTKIVNGTQYDFYHGTVTVQVSANFDKVSLWCFNHGSMNGEDLLMFSETCSVV